MQKPFRTQPALFVSAAELDHPALRALDDAEALPDWSEIERLLSSIYASRTGRPSYPLLTLFRRLLLGVRSGLSDVRLSQCLYRDLPFRWFCRLELGGEMRFVVHVPKTPGGRRRRGAGAGCGPVHDSIYRRS